MTFEAVGAAVTDTAMVSVMLPSSAMVAPASRSPSAKRRVRSEVVVVATTVPMTTIVRGSGCKSEVWMVPAQVPDARAGAATAMARSSTPVGQTARGTYDLFRCKVQSSNFPLDYSYSVAAGVVLIWINRGCQTAGTNERPIFVAYADESGMQPQEGSRKSTASAWGPLVSEIS
jgi:hypothetical protein